MSWSAFEICQLLIGSGIILGIGRLIFAVGKMVEKIDSMHKKIENIEHRLDNIEIRVGRIEGYLMGPTVLKEKGQ